MLVFIRRLLVVQTEFHIQQQQKQICLIFSVEQDLSIRPVPKFWRCVVVDFESSVRNQTQRLCIGRRFAMRRIQHSSVTCSKAYVFADARFFVFLLSRYSFLHCLCYAATTPSAKIKTKAAQPIIVLDSIYSRDAAYQPHCCKIRLLSHMTRRLYMVLRWNPNRMFCNYVWETRKSQKTSSSLALHAPSAKAVNVFAAKKDV